MIKWYMKGGLYFEAKGELKKLLKLYKPDSFRKMIIVYWEILVNLYTIGLDPTNPDNTSFDEIEGFLK